MVNKKWYVGTSGFMISQKNWLSQKQLNCIEINSSFYRTPTLKQIQTKTTLSKTTKAHQNPLETIRHNKKQQQQKTTI